MDVSYLNKMKEIENEKTEQICKPAWNKLFCRNKKWTKSSRRRKLGLRELETENSLAVTYLLIYWIEFRFWKKR